MTKIPYADIVVAGAGASGLTAAIAAAEAGAGRVIVLEKSAVLGGKANSAQGMYAIGSRLQKAAGVEISVEQEFKDILHSTSYMSDAVLLRSYLSESGKTVDWMLDHGIDFCLTEKVQQLSHLESGRVYHRWNHVENRFQRLRNIAEAAGVVFYMNTAAQSIRMEDGRVSGVTALDKDGSELFSPTGTVIISTGGFAGNRDMLWSILDHELAEKPLFFPTQSTGEGVKMAWSAGAGKASEHAVLTHGVAPAYERFSMHKNQTSKALMNIPILWVNDMGERYCNEELIYDSQFFSNSCMAQGGAVYALLDQAAVEQFKKDIPYEMQFWDVYGKDGGYFPAPVENFDTEIAELIHDGIAIKADTPEELADLMGWERETLCNTLARYNACVRAGVDTDFFKSAKYLKYPVSEPPFYTLKGRIMIMGTLGGVKVDRYFRAMTQDLKIVPGLYVTGSDAGGIYHGYSYLSKEGFALGWALTSGLTAGTHAAEHLHRSAK